MGCAKLLPQKRYIDINFIYCYLCSVISADGELTTSSNVKSLLLSNSA